jgi:hypothetical protein
MALLPWARPIGVFRPAQLRLFGPTWPFGPGPEAGELAPMAPVDGGPAEFQRLPVTRCSGEAPGSKVAGRWTKFGAAGRKKLTGEACPRRRGLASGKRRR